MKISSLVPVLMIAAGIAQAAVFSFEADLSGPAEAPPNASPGIGTALFTYDDSAHTLSFSVSFSGLTGVTTASHIHAATTTPGTGTAGVATQVPTFSAFPLGVTTGSFSQTLDLTQASSYNPSYVTAHGGTPAGAETALISAINGGQAYLNIHTATFPGGEIRGFLTPVPEPAETASVLTGLAGAGVLVFRRLRARKTA